MTFNEKFINLVLGDVFLLNYTMKANPKLHLHTNYVNESDIDFMLRSDDIMKDDLWDFGVESNTRFLNSLPKFHEKLTIKEIDLLTEDERLAYHQFLLDSLNEQ